MSLIPELAASKNESFKKGLVVLDKVSLGPVCFQDASFNCIETGRLGEFDHLQGVTPPTFLFRMQWLAQEWKVHCPAV